MSTVGFASDLAAAAAEDMEPDEQRIFDAEGKPLPISDAPGLVLSWESFESIKDRISIDNIVGIRFYQAPNLLPSKLFEMRNLRFLHFYGGLVWPTGIGDLQNLEKLEISLTGLTSFPIDILRLRRLKNLTLKAAISNIPDDLSELSELRSLCLYYNPLGTVPVAIQHLSRLRYLILVERN